MAKRVLVVDFDRGTLKSTVTMLKGRGFEVVAASSLEQVERALIPDAPDVALVEPALSGIDTYELCSLIHGSAAGSPSIILASHKIKGEALRFRASEIGAELFFERPINDQTLVQAIAEAVSSAAPAPRPAGRDTASQARAKLRAVPPAERSNTVELTSIGNTEFEGWLNDVFSGIEGPADPPPAVPAAPTTSANSAPSPTSAPDKPVAPASAASPRATTPQTSTVAPTPVRATAPGPGVTASPPRGAGPLTPPSSRHVGEPMPSASPGPSPEPTPAPTPAAPRGPANESPATATPVPVAPRKRPAPATEADFGGPTPRSRGPWMAVAVVAALTAVAFGGYFGWRRFAGGTAAPSTHVAALDNGRDNARDAARDVAPVASPGTSTNRTAAGEPAANEVSGAGSTDPAMPADAVRSPRVPALDDPAGDRADARGGAGSESAPTRAAAEPQPAPPSERQAAARPKPDAAKSGVTAGETDPVANPPADATASVAVSTSPQSQSQSQSQPKPQPVQPAPTKTTPVSLPDATAGTSVNDLAASSVASDPGAATDAAKERDPAAEANRAATTSSPVPAPAPARAAPPAARMPDPFEFVQKGPAKPKVIEAQTASVNPPRLIPDSRVEPKVPLAAQRFGVSGTVVLKAVVGPDGAVTSVEIVEEPNRKAGLGKAAAAAVSKWRYRPATMNGEPIESPIEVRITFAN